MCRANCTLPVRTRRSESERKGNTSAHQYIREAVEKVIAAQQLVGPISDFRRAESVLNE